jgi:hypothetical protein
MARCKDVYALRHLDYPQNIPIREGYRLSLQKAITNWVCNTLLRAGPVTMGRIPHGPLGWVRTWDGKASS